MTPQGYDAIAEIVHRLSTELTASTQPGTVLQIVVQELVYHFEQDNPGFDRSRFLERALGTTTEG